MDNNFDLTQYLTNSVQKLVKDILKRTLQNPKASLFLTGFLAASQRAAKLRKEAEENSEHIPPFLIASITSKCNLHCAGCYARAGGSCCDTPAKPPLTADKMGQYFYGSRGNGNKLYSAGGRRAFYAGGCA